MTRKQMIELTMQLEKDPAVPYSVHFLPPEDFEVSILAVSPRRMTAEQADKVHALLNEMELDGTYGMYGVLIK